MGFEELEFERAFPHAKAKRTEEEKVRVFDSKRYIIGCDPYDNDPRAKDLYDKGFNIFAIFDKASGKYGFRIVTKKTFDQFVADCEKVYTASSFCISRKFITDEGRSILGQISIGS